MSFLFNRMTIIGVGLIGGSLARAVKKQGLCGEVVGCDRNADELNTALQLGVIDRAETNIGAAIANADIVVLATPVGSMRGIMQALAPNWNADAILTDVGSVKQCVVDDARAAFSRLPPGFIPGHPIAGTEKSGVAASFDSLYDKRCVILTPVEESAAWAIDKTKSLWEKVGAEVVTMSAEHHDDVLAATSHLPHLLAFGLVDTLGRMHEQSEIFKFAAGGFRDFTRIASSDPVMWRDICIANRRALLAVIDRFSGDLQSIRAAIEMADSENLKTVFTRAKQTRDRYVVK